MAAVSLTLNGRTVASELDPATPLLWVLRDSLGLKGTKYGCGLGVCGACTVTLDGVATPSCTTTLAEAAGRRVVTVEGLSADGDHPLQRAWLAEQVAQCGYCQAGQLMTAAALLARHPRPTDADIDRAHEGVVCRCGTYRRIRRAIHRAAREMER